MISPYQFWIDLANVFRNPKQLIFGMTDLFASWLNTRSWWGLGLTLPLLCLTIIMVGGQFYLHFLGPENLLPTYWEAIFNENQLSTLIQTEQAAQQEDERDGEKEKEGDSQSLANSTLSSKEELSRFSNSLLLKVIQVDSSDTRANYLVAATLSNQGRLSHARQLMRRLAPENERGFAPAHAWIAADILQLRKPKNLRELAVLRWDLEQAQRWPGVEPLLMNAYAEILLRENKADEAIAVLREAGKKNSRLLLRLAAVQKQLGHQNAFDSLCDELTKPRDERLQKGTATEGDFIELVSIQLLKLELDKARNLAQAGLNEYPESRELKSLLSSSYMLAFEESAKKNGETGLRLELLDLAMKADPTNPSVQEKIASLVASGVLLSEPIAAFLREKLASGKATVLTHVLLAIGHIRKEELEKAMVHLEVAYGMAPTSPVILNNLALCLARTKPEQLPRAKKLMEVALSVSPPNAEMLDSYGEILMQLKDYVTAIRAFEAALTVEQDRQDTRKKLAEAYAQVALDDMADSVKKGTPGPPPSINKGGIIGETNVVPKR
jgi:tetratricopeptide (TPR) repeat protein